MLRIVIFVCALLLAPEAHAQRRYTDIDQSLIQPTVSGIAYNSRNERVFASLCPSPQFGARRFACNLAEIRLSGDGVLHYLRSGGEYGYTLPVVSSDGHYLFAARTQRNRRAGQPRLDQELVRIDLASDEEVVVQPASEYRYDRLVSLGQSGILAVQGYRTSDQVRCRGDFCTDAARVVLISNTGAYVLPGVETTADVASVHISVIPLGAESAWISAAVGQPSPTGWRSVRSWLFEGPTLRLSAPGSNTNVLLPLFEEFAAAHRDAVRWQWTQMLNAEDRAFPLNPDTIGGLDQLSLSNDGFGVRLTKRRDGRNIQLDIEIARNEGASPWTSVRQVSVPYTPPPRSRER